MEVSHYFEWEEAVTGGQAQSVRNQRKMLEMLGVDYCTEPDLEADILHLNNMGPKSVYYARKARERAVPVIIHTHQTAEDFRNSFAFSNALSVPMKPYLSYAYSLADLLICPSEYNRKTLESYTDVDKTIISNGFDPAKIDGFSGLRQEYLELYDLEPPVIFNVGHVIRRKGLEEFIETARQNPELDFAWFGYLNPMGSGGLMDRMLKSRETRKLVENSPENCIFTGYIDDIRGAYAAGDIFFFPTRNENEGIALLEAMAAGKPPIVSDIETFDWLEDGENCLKADSVDEFTGCVQELVEEPEKRKEIGKSSMEKSREFELEKVSEKLMDAYREVLQE